ncbi:MAG: OmpA family protein [Pseudomonadaceae bacterium]|nr:OmpA family protein [Pseudomonadaceae bacterium]
MNTCKRNRPRFRKRLTLALASAFALNAGISVYADTPNLSAAPPAEAFVGEEFCFDAGITNSGSAGYGPYHQIITKPDYTLASADFIGLALSPITVGTFPAAPGNQLTDPVSGLDVTGPEGGTLYAVRYPVGSVVTGQPSLEMELCIDVDAAATIDVLETDAFEVTPGYEFGDTPTGDNGATIGTRTDYDFTPRVITYQVSDILAEMENPPGPAWTWDIEVVADIAADRTVTPIDFSTVSPIVLPANVQFVGPVTFTGSGVTCTATSPAAPPPESPGGSVDLDCVSGTGTPGEDRDIVATFPVYIVDTLDEGTCGTAGAINTAKHVTLRKSSTGGTFPGGTVTYTLAFQVSEFVDGIDSLSLEDVMPDGLTFVNSPTVTYNGGGATAITPTVANDTPGTGETTVTYDVTGVTGALLPATSGFITYSATIDQTYAGGALAGQPVRARDDLANSVIGTYDITNGANACTDDSAETITVPDVTSSKTLVGSANVQPGDSVTWRLQLDVPSGDVQGIEFNDYFPLPVFDVSTIDTNTNIAANTDISFGPNDTLGVNPTSITAVPAENRLAIVWPDIVSAMGETIEVDVAVVVSNEPFADGLVLSNLFQAITDNSAVDNGDALNIDDITLQQPELAISKTATTAATGLEAGDSVSFDIDITNDGSAEAFDVTVTDTLPTSLTSCVVDSVTGGTGAGDIFGAGFTFATFTGATANALDPGDSATIAITCDIAATAANNESIDNEVSVVWATQPGATLFPAQTAQETVSTRQAQAFKEIVTTSEASTAEGTADTNGDPRPVATGEVIRYRTWFYIPQGTLGGVSVRDLLPAGLAHIADSETLVGLVSDSGTDLVSSALACATGTPARAGNDATDLSTLALDCTLAIAGTGGSGQDPVLSLGTLTNSEDDANEELVVLELNARVVGDVATGANMNNRARLQTSNGNATSGGVFVQQTNPAVDITKTVMPSTADAEDTVEYVITVEHNATDSTADAFDISFTDIIQPELTYDGGTGVTGPQAPTVADTCTAAGVVVDDADPAGAGITITFDSLPQGESCEVRYFAETAAGVVPGQTIDNTVNLGYSSLPGNGTDPNPTGSTPGAEAAFVGSDTAQLTIDSVEIEKSIIATDFAHTSDASAGTALDPRQVAVGETLSYRLQMRLPEGTANNYEVTDLLPAGLAYVASSARVAFVFDGGGAITPTPGIVCSSGTLNQAGNEGSVAGITPTCGLEPTGGPFNSGTDPVWDLGDLVNTDMDANQEFVVIEFDARVQNETSNQDGDTLSNTYELSVDGDVVTSSAVVAEVVEPQLTLAAVATPNPVDNRVDTTPTVSWDITLANAGNATAFQIDSDSGGGWEIVLPTGIDNITSLALTPTGSVFNNGTAVPVVVGDITVSTTNNTNDTLTFANPFQMAPGSSLLVEFDADLLASVLPGDTPSGVDDVVYAGNDTGSTATGIRDDASLANGTGNTPITDTTDLDDYRTEVTLAVATVAENPALSVGKTITAGPVNLGTGSFTLTYTIALENTGDVGLDTIAIEDNLDTTFGAGNYVVDDVRVTSDSTTLAEDVAYTGAPATIELLLPGTSTLPVGESGAIEIDLTVTPSGGLGPFTNTAVGTSQSDRTGNAANDNGAVDVTFDDGGELGLAKRVSAGPTNNNDGTYTLDFEFLIDNSGLVVLDNILLADDLATTFADATSFTVDNVASADFSVNFPGFDGDADTALLDGSDTLAAGADGTVTLTVTVTPGADLGPYENFAIVQADTPADATLSDQSEDGTNPDGNSNGDPTDDADLTIVTFAEDPDIGAAKAVSAGPTNNGDGTYTLTYTIVLENVGDVPLVGVQATDNLQATFAGATSFTVDNVTSTDFSVNFPGFTGTGAGSTSLLDGTDGLAVGATGSIDLTVTVTPGANLGPYNNQATGSAEGPGGTNASDVSDNGSDPDGNGNGDPSDDNDVTPVTFVEDAEIGVAKAVAAGGPTNNGDGSFTLTYDILVENSGDVPLSAVQVTDDLATAFAGATSFTIDNVVSGDFTVNFPGFNGDGDQDLLTGVDTLAVGASGTINLTVTVTPGANLGPYNNAADASGDTPGGATTTDTSDSGTDPDGNGNGDPTDDSDPTPITFAENPEIGLAKAIQGAVTNNGDGSYELTYRFVAENSGDSPLSDVQITDDLATAFAGATFTVDAVASTDFTVNFPGFNGDGDQELLAAGNSLATGASGTVDVTVTVTPGANLGPYNNTADAQGTAPGGGVANDTSDDGTDPDGNGNGDPTDDSDVTPVTFAENPELGLAKEIPAAPTNNLDGSFTLTYRLFLENSGDVPVNDVQISDDLASVFASATSFTVDNVTSADFAVNFPGFNGDADANLLAGTDDLAVAASGSVDVTVTVTPGADLGPYDNTADASGTSAGGAPVTDTSHLGTDPDGNGNGDPSDDSDVTPVTFVEGPAIAVAKSVLVAPVNNADGSYSLTYRIAVSNSGDTPLNGVQVTDDLEAVFGVGAVVVDSVTALTLTENAGYDGLTAGDINLLDGTDSLAVGASADIDLAITVTPGANLGPFVNTATASGTSPGNQAVNSPGNAPNVSFTEAPEIGVAKQLTAAPTNNGDGTYTLSYLITVENSGDVPLSAVQIDEDLTTTFALADSFAVDSVVASAGLTAAPGFNGDAVTGLLAGTDVLAVAQSETVTLTLTVTPAGVLGPYNNTAVAAGTSPSGAASTDNSTDGVDPDTNGNGDPTDDSVPTVVTFAEAPELGLAKALVSGPTNNGDGSYTLGYQFVLENSGDVVVNGLQISDDLSTTFAGATFVVDSLTSADVTVNAAGFNGAADTDLLAGTDSLAVGASATIDLTVTVTPGANLGPYDNSAQATGTSPTGAAVADTSTDGADPDSNGNGDPTDDSDVTPVTFTEAPELGLAKAVSAGPTNNGDGTYTLDYRFVVENSGDVVINNLQIVDDLATTFADAASFTVDSVTSATLTVNFPGFNGAADTNLLAGTQALAVAASATVDVTVTVTPGADLGPYDNTSTADGESPTGAPVSDVSDAGADPDGNGNGDPSDDSNATSTTFSEAPQIGVAKQITQGPVNNADGTHTLTYAFLVENTGDVALTSVQVSDDLAATFTGASSFTVDSLSSADFTVAPGYDGSAITDLLAGTDTLAVGASGSLELVVTVTPGGNLGPYANSATGTGISPANTPVSDLSDDAADVDENGNGDPGDDSDSTDVTFTENPVIGVAKALLAGPDNNGDGSYSLTYQFVVSNDGDVDLSSVNIVEDLAAVFAAADSFSVDSVSSATLSPAATFDGVSNTSLLDGTDVLAVGAQATVDLAITVVPGANLGPYQNVAAASGESPSGQSTTDDSVAGGDPDANGNGDPTDDSSSVDVTFAENPQLGLAKTATLSTPNFDGTFTTTIELTVVNSGDVEIRNLIVADDLATNLAPATVTGVANVAVVGSLAALNPNFDGIADPNITDGSESLAPGESAVITFDLTFNGNGNIGPFSNLANVAGESPGNPNPGQPNVEDDSTEGNDPDANGNGDPTDDTTPTVIEFNPGVDGTVDITDESVPGDLLDVTVTDADENMDPAVIESFDVTVVNDQTGESEVITVVETGPDTGVFVAQVPTTFAPNAGVNDDGTLVTRPEDTVTVLYEDRLTSVGDVQTRTDTGVVIGLATIEGNAWLDSDTDDVFDIGETPLDGWIIRVERDGVFVAEVPVNPDGSYSIAELLPGAGYSVSLIHPDSGVTFGVLDDLDLPPETVVLEQNLPIDPTGVFYDSVERAPVEGVVTTIVNSAGTPLPDACLLPNQQDQTSAADGLYRFDLILDAAPACPSGETFTLVYQVPAEFNPGISALLPPIGGALDPTGLGNPVRVAPQSGAPTLAQSTDYYLAFTLENGDPDIVFNHIPLDPLGVGGFTVRLTKDVNQPTATVGSLVSYTITLENLSTVTLPGVSVVDSLPPGFSYVEDSAILDDGTDALIVSGTRPVTFAGINLAPDTRRVLRYVLRTGAGVTRGEYVNTAEPFIGPAPIGNRDSAEVVVIADPDFEETTVIGKVWNDRDQDGWQDLAIVSELKVSVQLANGDVGRDTLVQRGDAPAQPTDMRLSNGAVVVAELPGRYGAADLRDGNRVVLRERFDSPVSVREVAIRTNEGSVIKLDELGNASMEHRGQVRRGENSQSLEASYDVIEVDGSFELRVEIVNVGMDEPGIPGVRLATVEGLLIETDAYGRYHIAGVDGGFFERGRNFIVKVDPETLPAETTFTTENPRVKRISQGLMNRFDFGVHLPESAPLEQRFTVKIAEMFFIPGSSTVEPGYLAALRDLADKLANGSFVTLSIEAFVDPADADAGAARDLAERRAQALIEVLCELADRDVSANIDVQITPIASAAGVGDTREGGSLMSMKQWLGGLLMSMSSVAWASEHNIDCSALDACRSADGIPVIVVEEHSPSVYEPSTGLPDQGRVDLYGETVQRLVGGGVVWLTEDPAALTPQLAIEGPSHLPLRGGQIDGDQEFVIYTNYAAFIDSLEVRVYRDRDVDRRDPVVVMTIDTSDDKRNLYRLAWSVNGDTNLAAGVANALGVSGLNYELIATSANGERDRTSVKRMFFIDADLYDSHQAKNNRFGESLVPEVILREAEDGIVVFLPPISGSEAARTLRFTFAELSAELSDADKAQLAAELDRLEGTELVRIRADGHTSSLGIASRSRHIFADNYALSKARAQSVVDFAREHLGSLDAAVETNGFGPKQPVATNATPEGRATNRRVATLLATQTEGDSSKVVVVDRATGAALAYQPRTVTSLADSEDGRAQDPALRAMGRNDLATQRIPVYGSRIRIQGTDLGEDYRLWLNGEPVYVDDARAFAYEYLLPIGEHRFDLVVANSARVVVERSMPVMIDGQYHFMVALADFTASDNDISGSLEALSGDDRYDEDMLVEGRLAFYLKGKVKGKYLITAQLDTREEEIDDLFSKIHEKDPDSLFRRLDPDRYYPVYGDDSKTVADTNSHGRMYVRVDWDRSQALWGNFDTGLTGNELIQYNRGLYGARLSYESLAATEHDDTKTLANVFASEGQTALGHSEFLGTGGSLYYLRHTDILPGSDKLRIEIRDPDTNRVIDNQLLTREIDYEVDEIQGRVILSKPLLQVSTQSAPSLINDGPVDGNVTILVADYEYVPDGFDANNLTAGARAKHWISDSIAVGGTYVEEGRSNEDYRLGGVDITLKPKQGTYLKVEWASAEATQTSRFFSTDGGLSFANSTPTGQGDRAGDAWGVDLHINAGDYGGNSEWVSNLWFRDVDDQYSVARRDDGNNTQEYGFETQLPVSDTWLIGLRASRVDVQDQFELTDIGLQSDWRIGERGVLASELKHVDQRRTGQADADALLAGLQYEHRLTDRLTMFGGGQVTVEQNGPYDNNDAVNLGAKLAVSSDTNAEIELRDGHRGSGGVATLEHALNSKHTVYGTVTHSTDTTNDPFARSDNGASMLDNVGTNFAVGHRWRLNDRTLIFTEGQHSRGPDYSGVGEVFGIDYAMKSGWHLGFTAQDGEITGNNGLVDRQSLTVATGYQSRRINFSSRLEHRDDSGAEDVVQWLTTNRLDFKINETYRLATKLNWSDSDSDLGSDEDAKLVEGSIGLARRPVDTNRFNWLAKYTYLYDLQSFGQEDSETDQRSHVMSWEGIYRLNRKFDLGGKVARRESELRLGRNSGPWFESTANFASTRLRWHVIHNWDGMLEYRWLEVEEADNERAGFLATISRHIGEHFKVGVGYNFTDFSDDLTDLDYDHKGFFLNVVGKY